LGAAPLAAPSPGDANIPMFPASRGLCAFALLTLAQGVSTRENPIRKVVTLLQSLRTEVEEEGEEAQKLFDKFQCYCGSGKEQLEKSIEQGRNDIGEYEATMKELTGSNAQLEMEIEELKKEVAEAETTVEDATGVRTKEHEEYIAESTEITNSISALDKAIPAIQKGLDPATALMQVNLGASVLLANTRSVEDHMALESLLQSQSTAATSAPGTEQILGILQQMRDNFKEDLEQSTKNEQETQETYEQLKSAKAKQVAALTSELREKTERVSAQAAALAAAKENHEDTSNALKADEQFFVDLQENCGTKAAQFDANTRARAQEVQAIGQAIKILNDDSSLDLFKKTLGGGSLVQAPSFLQVRVAKADDRAARALKAASAAGHFPGLTLIQTALKKAAPEKFGPVKKMINDMIANLQTQEQEDVQQKDFCNQALPESEHTKDGLNTQIADGQRLMDELKTKVQQLAERIQASENEIKELDASVEAATEQRKAENAEFTKCQAENAMAITLINKAKDKLGEIYRPAEEPEALIAVSTQTTEEQQPSADEQMDEMLGLSFVELSSMSALDASMRELAGQKADPGAPPQTADYSAKTGQGAGIMALMDELIGDLKLETQRAQSDESEAQRGYEKELQGSQDARKATSREIVAMQEQKANIAEETHEAKKTHGEHKDELAAIESKIAALHDECDFLLANMDLRKQARASELDAMRNALSILSGADFSFRQGLRLSR